MGQKVYAVKNPKKMLNMYILEVLKKYSDSDHHLKQQDIIEYIKQDYNISSERKAISINISRLVEFGYDIVHQNGYYLRERDFDDSELRLLVDSVLFSRNIPTNQAKDLIEKLQGLSSKYFSLKVKHVSNLNALEHTNNKQFFYNIEILDEAIENGNQVEFMYNKYGEDKKLHPRKKEKTLFNPYQMVASNGRYYVIGNVDKYEGASYYRLDKISDMAVLNTPVKPMNVVQGLEKGLNLPKHMAEHIYMFSGKSEKVTFNIDKSRLDDVVDWFGNEFKIRNKSDDIYTISVDVNTNAMYYWALQYGQYAEIISPIDLREKLQATISQMCERYNSN
ncbi:MAG: WYL domain-containing protein [Ruminococcus sp.]|nr:WYL domain-containing protein [Ruminococcus sp.]